MKKQNIRLQLWLEQGNTIVPQLFFQNYKKLHISDEEALLLLHLLAFHAEKKDFPTPSDFTDRMGYTENEITHQLQRLIQKGFIEITQGIDDQGKLFEKYSLLPLWERLIDYVEATSINAQEEENKKNEANIFSLFEQEFGRLLSPIEIETITMWLDVDDHSPEIIKAALKEAVLSGKLSFRYIDRILFEWKKKNLRTIQQIQQHTDQFRDKTMKPTTTNSQNMEQIKKVTFYNWLEERE